MPSLIVTKVRESAAAQGICRLAKREWAGVQVPTTRELVIEIAIMIAIGVALAALGPFGSFAMGSFAERLAYWVPAALFGYALFRPLLLLVRRQAERLDLPDNAALLAGLAIAAAPATFVILWWNEHGFGELPSFSGWFQLYVQVALVGALVTLIFAAIERRSSPSLVTPERAAAEPEPADPRPPFMARLPRSWTGPLLALEMEDHYVRAHGLAGSTLILMRLRDAEAELSAIDGLRTHRSWWVARDAVEDAVRDGRSYKLKLKGGLEAPVARDRIAALRAAGWLA